MANTNISPRAFIGENVKLHPSVKVMDFAFIDGNTEIKENTVIYPFASIGTPAEYKNYEPDPDGITIIGKNNIIREHVTVNAPVHTLTQTGDDCLIFTKSHIAHDCLIGDHVVFSGGVRVAGHSQVGNYTTVGLNASLHQWCVIGDYSMIGMLSPVNHDVLPFSVVVGNPARILKLNSIAVERYIDYDATSIKKLFQLADSDEIHKQGLKHHQDIFGSFEKKRKGRRLVQFIKK